MISAPQADFKHTGHVGPDGQFFGDITFLGSKVIYQTKKNICEEILTADCFLIVLGSSPSCLPIQA
jgi:hypothetical protein